ncbi:MAG TPA: peptidylprolyl isomerase [Pyrinomonadaceae bacterium]|nr:peptidylprolyl isomerase [Pyrinomonadaceae bacterium]
MAERVKDGDTVRVHYTGRLDDGTEFDSSKDGDPLEFKVGAGEVIAGFDDAVRGMEVGETRTFQIEPEDAYGARREQLVSAVPREGMRLDDEPKEGMTLVMQLPDGQELPVSITEVTDTHVTLDANHPLAGQRLTFDVTLVENKEQG